MQEVTYDFSNRIAVVTGGANGIGSQIASQYLDAGAKVVIWDLHPPKNKRKNAIFKEVDVSDLSQVENATKDTINNWGKIDFLSHNAGYAGPTENTINYDTEAWIKTVQVNLIGPYIVAKTVAPCMVSEGYGRIINMASLAGKEGTPYASAYSAAKAGVIGFTKSLAKELAETNVRVNCVAPAAVKTNILDQMEPDFVETMIAKSPMKRLGSAREVADIVMWLSSSACSFNTGAVFDMSGGRATY